MPNFEVRSKKSIPRRDPAVAKPSFTGFAVLNFDTLMHFSFLRPWSPFHYTKISRIT